MKSSTPTSAASSGFSPATPSRNQRSLSERLDRIARLAGWRRLLFSFGLGALSAFAFPPGYAMPLLWLIYPLLLVQLMAAKTHRAAFGIGWAYGFGQFSFAFYWLTFSMFTDIARWWWAVPFASTILPIALGFIPGFACMLWWFGRWKGVRAVLSFTLWFMAGEWIRGHFLTGFPWNLTGQGWIGWPWLLQSFSFLGQYALGFITIAAAGSFYLLVDGVTPRRAAIGIAAAGIAVFTCLAGYGAVRLSHDNTAQNTGLLVRLVQPNFSQSEKWSKDRAQQNFRTLLALSETPTQSMPDIVVWPETAVPFPLDLSPEIPKAIATAMKPGGMVLTGTLRRVFGPGDRVDYYNSLEAIDNEGHRLAHYDKVHLAPFGEYMPFRSVLPLDALAVGGSDLSFGAGAATLTVPGVPPFSPLICYEAIFPENVVDHASRPEWLLQITNDGWFGKTAGPHQHFAMARARAVEQGMPLLRAANTGISGGVDAYGRLLAFVPLMTRDIADVKLPLPLPEAPFYARHGDIIFLTLMLATLLIVTTAKKMHKN